jgi:glycosyltransferase involved in cell wall biosynthesis
VVCLKLGGPPSFVNASSGVVVPARDAKDEAELVDRLAAAIESVTSSTAHWQRLHEGALVRAEQLTWERQIAHIQTEIRRVLRLSSAPVTSETEGAG